MKSLGILKQNIVLWHMLFDKGAFKHKGLNLAAAKDVFKILNPSDHLPHLFGVMLATAEILTDAVAQCLCLADIYDFARLVLHNVDTGCQWQSPCLFH